MLGPKFWYAPVAFGKCCQKAVLAVAGAEAGAKVVAILRIFYAC